MDASSKQFSGIVIVVDQMGYNYIDRLSLPFLTKLKSESTFFTDCYVGHVPAQTATCHATLSTGLLPDEHGILGNRWVHQTLMRPVEIDDPLAIRNMKDIKDYLYRGVESIGEKAKHQDYDFVAGITGKKYSAAMFAGGVIDYVIYPEKDPNTHQWSMVGLPPNKTVPFPLPAPTIPIRMKWENPKEFDRLVYETTINAINYVKREVIKKWLILVSFSGTDFAGHYYGPYSYATNGVVQNVDKFIGGIYDKFSSIHLLDKIYFVVTSDHGAKTLVGEIALRYTSPRSVILRFLKTNGPKYRKKGGLIMYIAKNDINITFLRSDYDVVAENDFAYIYKKRNDNYGDYLLRAKSLEDFTKIPYVRCIFYRDSSIRPGYSIDCEQFLDRECVKLFKRAFQHHTICANILVPEEGFTFVREEFLDDMYPGSHGSCYDSEDNLHIPLIVRGPCVKRNHAYRNKVTQDEIAPMLASLMNIPAPNNTGTKANTIIRDITRTP